MKTMRLHFKGKDSVIFDHEIDVPDEIASMIQSLQKNKKDDEMIFDLADEGSVNEFLSECMPDCTAKLFRTAHGTMLLAQELQKSGAKKGMTQAQLKNIYDNAALAVSKKLNHQRNVAKGFKDQKAKLDENLSEQKKKLKELKEKSAKDLLKIKQDIKTARECYSGEKLEAKLQSLKEKKDKIKTRLEKAEARLEKTSMTRDFKVASKNIAIGTAKSAYSSPLVAYSFAKDTGMDIGNVYSKAQQKTFEWAEDVSKDYWKKYPNV